MPANLPPQLSQMWARVKQVSQQAWTRVRDSSERRWTWVRDRSQIAWARAVKISKRGWAEATTGARRGWISFRDSWTKQDWFAGIKPLPPGMAGNLTAIAIVVGLVFTSLGYGELYERAADEARLIASGEHPSQQVAPPVQEEEPAPVPEPATPEAAPAPAAPSASSQLPQLGEAFIDRFDTPELDPRWFVSDGWSNGDYMENDWRANQITSGEGGLKLVMDHGPEGSKKPLASGEIRTNQAYRYGYFEVRMRAPRDPGLIAGVFTYAERKGAVRPNEIDIEFAGRDTRQLELTVHENGKPTHTKIRLPFDAADGFHSYAFDWRPNAVRWYVDGKFVHEVTGGAATRLTRPQQLILNLWSSKQLKNWVGPLNVTRAPWTMQVACVAYAPSYAGKTLCN